MEVEEGRSVPEVAPTASPDMVDKYECDKSSSGPSTPSSGKDNRPSGQNSVLLRRVYSDATLSDVVVEDDNVDNVKEYQWPLGGGRFFVLQEHVSKYLGVLSFKRKYPDINRHLVEAEEKCYLLDNGLVSSFEADLGLAALNLDEVLDLMQTDYPDKYRELITLIEERRKKRLSEKMESQKPPSKMTKPKIAMMRKRAIKACVDFNKRLNAERQIERPMSINMQTWLIERPVNKEYKLDGQAQDTGKVILEKDIACDTKNKVEMDEGRSPLDKLYPVALIPGQYQNYYRPHTSEELFRLPLRSTVRQIPEKEIKPNHYDDEDDLGEYISDSDKSDISELSIDSNLSEKDFDEAAEIAFSSSPAKDIKLTIRQKELIIEQQNKALADDLSGGNNVQQDTKKQKNKRSFNIDDDGKETKFQKWLKQKNYGKKILERMILPEESETPEITHEDSPSHTLVKVNGKIQPVMSNPITIDASSMYLVCKVCKGNISVDKSGDFLMCSCCRKVGHPKCLDITGEMLAVVKDYNWQCMDCKTCIICQAPHAEDKMMFCDACDRGFHTFCISLTSVPTGRWICHLCNTKKSDDSQTI